MILKETADTFYPIVIDILDKLNNNQISTEDAYAELIDLQNQILSMEFLQRDIDDSSWSEEQYKYVGLLNLVNNILQDLE